MPEITLDYTVGDQGARSRNEVGTAMAAATIFEGELALLGMFRVAESTIISIAGVTRRVSLRTTAAGDVLFPTNAALIFATRNLYTAAFALKTPAEVVAATPVIIP